jgi:hypothetical protein
MKKAGTKASVVMLDEIDKLGPTSQRPSAALLVLDPSRAAASATTPRRGLRPLQVLFIAANQ